MHLGLLGEDSCDHAFTCFSFRIQQRFHFTKTYKPGEKAPDSGELVEIGPRGGKVEAGRYTVIERGERIPPTSEEGN